MAIYLYDEHEDALFFGTGLSEDGKEERPPVPVHQDDLTKTVALQGQTMVIHDARQHPLLTNAEWQVGAIASIPLRKSDHVLGVFDISFRGLHTFTQDELRVLHLLADQAAIAIENAQLYADIQRANIAKNEFAGIVSHEFKAPMTSIQGYARLMALEVGGPVTEQQREFIEIILRNVRRMNRLVNDLLDLSRIESGRIRISTRPIDLSKSIDQAVRIVHRDLHGRQHQITVDVPDNLPKVDADADRITQVWINLLSNAYRYTPDQGQIKVWARRHKSLEANSGEKQWVLCAVEDTGIGFSPEELERIFEPFYRIQHPEAAHERGTGLELAITRSIIELHGGRIWMESEAGKGSTFYFTLPGA